MPSGTFCFMFVWDFSRDVFASSCISSNLSRRWSMNAVRSGETNYHVSVNRTTVRILGPWTHGSRSTAYHSVILTVVNLALSSRKLGTSSGGARVFAVRGKRLCCRPHQSDQVYNHEGIFRISYIADVNQLLGSPPLPSLFIISLSLSSPLQFYTPSTPLP